MLSRFPIEKKRRSSIDQLAIRSKYMHAHRGTGGTPMPPRFPIEKLKKIVDWSIGYSKYIYIYVCASGDRGDTPMPPRFPD